MRRGGIGCIRKRGMMGRTLTPERRELFEEALELRRSGLTEQNIAGILGQPQQTISYWLSIVGNDTIANIGKEVTSTKNTETAITNNPLTLYQGKYEDVYILRIYIYPKRPKCVILG